MFAASDFGSEPNFSLPGAERGLDAYEIQGIFELRHEPTLPEPRRKGAYHQLPHTLFQLREAASRSRAKVKEQVRRRKPGTKQSGVRQWMLCHRGASRPSGLRNPIR